MDWRLLTAQERTDFLQLYNASPNTDLDVLFEHARKTGGTFTFPVIDLYIASQLKDRFADAQPYLLADLTNMGQREVNQFSTIFGLDSTDPDVRTRIVRILSFMDLVERPQGLEELPADILSEILVQTPYDDVIKLCQSSTRIREVCQRPLLWLRKLEKDFGVTQADNPEELYSILSSNDVWSFGNNEFGQLGLNDRENRNVPTSIPNIKAQYVAAGDEHTIIIDTENNIWSFGSDGSGQLGSGGQRMKERVSPAMIPNIKARYAAAGGYHTIIIDMENNVWSFGYNEDGQLGLGDRENRYVPTRIPDIKAQYVAAGYNHTILIDMDNNVWSFGHNRGGRLGFDDNLNRASPSMIPNIKAQYVAAGYDHTILIDMDNNVWSFGHNYDGQLGLGDDMDRYVPTMIPNIKAQYVAAGADHTIIIDKENNVWSSGNNEDGQLGLDDNLNRASPTMIPDIKAQYVAAGGHHTIIIDMDNNVWSFGHNGDGQLGLGDDMDRYVPTMIPNIKARYVAAGGVHTILIGKKV